MREITNEEKLFKSVEPNVRASVSQLSNSSRLIEALVHQEKMKILGAVLDLSAGRVRFLDV